ncbi:uncharacterized protein LOC108145442 isoform X1 [Drosophila elegans]|uniref:uncharacterized protein LOC108145442 isoform X1 n=1 Tax=Drosophila elegans TaxID=30023 RepID=UPI0007E7B89D|nr:uncharacterized protein LOC108145442 isoform X1 [Drosophila elegans]
MTADPISLCFWICLQPDRYVPGSPIFRDTSSPTPHAALARPITSPPVSASPCTAAASSASTTASSTACSTTAPGAGGSTATRSRGVRAMTASLAHAAQGNHNNNSSNRTNSNSGKSKPPAGYMSTRSAAMMALALGQPSGSRSDKSPPAPRSASPAQPQTASQSQSQSPHPGARRLSNASSLPGNVSRSKPSTPTATRAAAQLNGSSVFSGGSNSSGSDNDGFSTSGSSAATALRRLYFKSGRSIKNKINASTTSATPLNGLPLNPVSSAYHNSVAGPMHNMTTAGGVPKLVVMGTSSASIPDTTINTSTDSACTLITNVTHTDTSETCDSLDLGDNSGPSEPLFSSLEEPLLTAVHIDSEHEGFGGICGGGVGGGGGGANGRGATELELTSCSRYPPKPDMNLQDSVESQESCLSILNGEPSSTTPLLSSQRRHTAGGHSPGSHREERRERREREPSTAPPPTRAREHFTFDPPQSPKSARSSEKSASHFPFKSYGNEMGKDAGVVMGAAGSGAGGGGGPGTGVGGNGMVAASEGDEEDDERSGESVGNRSKKLRPRERDPNHISPSVSPSHSRRASPKREKRRSTPIASTGAIAKVSSAPPTMKEANFFGSSGKQKHRQTQNIPPHQLSPSSQQRKYSSSSSSGSSERCLREATGPGTMFPFDREALDYERIQRECFAPSSTTASNSSDSEAENCSVYERKSGADIFQQYSRLSHQEQLQQHFQEQRDWERDRDRPPSRKNSKRIRPDSVIHTTIRENQQYVPQSDAFYPQAKSSSSPSDHSYAELNKFEDIASKFEQIPPKHGSSSGSVSGSLLNLHHMMPSPGSESAVSPTDSARRRSFKSKQRQQQQQQKEEHFYIQTEDRNGTGGGSGSGPINVTANPLEAAAVCKQPRATIVVQQPSLSLDNTVETLLIKNEGDFISVEQGKELVARKRNSQQLAHPPAHLHSHHPQTHVHNHHQQQQLQQQQHKRDENMRQLLDVTNTLTIEELRDFEMRYGSPHHSRSQSVKMPGSRASGRPNQLCLPQQRSRVASMPNTGVEEEYYRLRHFSITGKGVVNRGDSLKSRRSRSNNSVASSNSSTEHLTAQQQLSAPASVSARTSLASSRESSTSNPGNGPYRVLMLGGPAVGKSSLVSQFMTSEYLHAYDTSIDDESGEKAVSVLLSGEESELIFIDHGYTEMTPDECLTNYDPHGYCVIYSAADRSSFSVAEQVLQVLWTNQNIAQKAVILVSNKADLARSRLVTSEEGKAMATAYDCKFIETSVGINHNVDELLVGLLSQIRLKLENPEKSRDLFRKRSIRKSKRRACSPLNAGCLNASTPLGPLGESVATPPGSAQSSPRKYRGSRTSTSLKVKGLLGRVWTRDSKSKSCENLHVL